MTMLCIQRQDKYWETLWQRQMHNGLYLLMTSMHHSCHKRFYYHDYVIYVDGYTATTEYSLIHSYNLKQSETL